MATDALPFHSLVCRWFGENFAAPTEPQRDGWPAIGNGRHTLIAAPTGMGKTLAAFLHAIDQLVRRGLSEGLADETVVLYISPLKALSNDVQRNLELPLAGINALLRADGRPPLAIRTMVRTGDTPASERARAIRRPPHIVVTTPESLYILLSSAGGRAMLRTVRTVIVDEIHAIVESKRGAHLALSLERLEALCPVSPQRIGLSATQRPIARVARFLVGAETAGGDPRACTIVDSGHRRALDLAVEVPASPLTAVLSGEVWGEIYDRLALLIREHHTTLVFVNTRRLAERLARHLSERLGEAQIAAHHGSLSREKRFDAEQRLKAGQLSALVATASLELGIDIGDVDLVCQIGSTKRIATFLQRVGRAGHRLAALPKGRIFPLSLDELVEVAATFWAVREGDLDQLVIPEAPLDVLAQQIVAEVANAEWACDGLFELVTRAYPYQGLSRRSFDEVVSMLADGFSTRRGRRGAYLHLDAVNNRLRGRRGARLAAVTSGGAIPDNADYTVIQDPQGIVVGSVNEDFAIESMQGDIFQLGNMSWRILKLEQGKLRVEDAQGLTPSVPFWLGEAPARSAELSRWVSRLRQEVSDKLLAATPELARFVSDSELSDPPLTLEMRPALGWLRQELGLGAAAAEQLVEYLSMGLVALRVMPTQETLVLERFFDESGGMQLVIHSPFGARLNRGWGLALRKRFCRSFNFELQAAATEDAIVLSLGHTHSFPLDDVFRFLSSATVESILVQAMLDAPVFTTRWRWTTNISLAVLRFRGGRKVPPQFQRMDAEDLVAVVFPDQLACLENIAGDREIPDHPLISQTITDCLHEAMDSKALVNLLAAIERGEKRLVSRDLRGPSPLAQEILTAKPYAFLDDAPLEERRTQAVLNRRLTTIQSAAELGRLDPAVIAQVCEQIWPTVRDADELHDALLTAAFLTEAEGSGAEGPTGADWMPWFEALIASRRATVLIQPAGLRLWVAAERLAELLQLFADAALTPIIDPAGRGAADTETVLRDVLRARMEVVGPITVGQLALRSGLAPDLVARALAALEAQGVVFRGQFLEGEGEEQWCDRGVLARIHRGTVDTLRREIQPVTRQQFMRFLLHWHRLDQDDPGQGSERLAAILLQLEGFEAAAAGWDSDILPRRLQHYSPFWLDELTLAGRFAWLRLSSPAAPDEKVRRGGPVRATPIAFVCRRNISAWRQLANPGQMGERLLSSRAEQVLGLLSTRGALFHDDLLQSTRALPVELEQALGELVFWGAVTADNVNGLRALLLPAGKRRARAARPGRRRRPEPPTSVASAGRWSALEAVAMEQGAATVDEASVEMGAWALLRRYGVIFRALLERESVHPTWRELHRCYRRLEARGEIRGGRFVDGFAGEQFALIEAVGPLRQIRRDAEADTLVVVGGCDPLNLVGIVVPGERVAALADNRVVYLDGLPVAACVSGELRLSADLDPSLRDRITRSLGRGRRSKLR